MSAYVLAEIEITNPEGYKEYTTTVPATIAKYGGRFLVRGGEFENPEGGHRARNIVLEFPTYEAARECWRSPEYQEAAKLRAPIATADVVIVCGYEGPQP